MGSIPPPVPDIWGADDNARRYDEYARQYPNYRDTSRDLIALALPPGDAGVADAAVLDLACGTGATTHEILAVLGPHGRVTGVDQSAAMLAVAASSTTDSRVSWIHARAESVDQHVTGTVDAVLCNSAIWQTDLAATAKAARAVLNAGGRFAFNVPVNFLGDAASDTPGDRFPSLLSEMRAIAEDDYGWAPPAKIPGRARQLLTRESICRALEAAGFDLELATEVSHLASAAAARAWLSIPIFTRDRLSGLSYAERMRVLDKAYERLGPGQTERGQWLVFVWRASDSGSRGQRGSGS
jgi:SAM-dependent methyltransferase